ncbi:hAT family dimerization domain protein, partial [Metarhizium robertsii]
KRPWSLFGTSRLARLIERTNPPKQCENCWDYHTRHACNRQTRCKRCGKTNHASDSCTAPEQCANCLGPHAVDLVACPARPKRVHGLLHRLPKEQRALVRQMGSRLFQQHQAAQQRQQSQTEPSGQPASEAAAEQQRAPVAVMEVPQEHVNPQALTNFFSCTLPVLPSSSPMRPRRMWARSRRPTIAPWHWPTPKNMTSFLKKTIKELPPVEHIRIRCLGHVINLAASAFIYRQNNEADELSKLNLPTQGKKKEKDEIKSPSKWRKLGPVGKLFNLVKLIHASNANMNSFTNITGCQMPLPNATRWNSWFIMIHKALKLRKGIIQWSSSRKSAQEDCLTHDEWRELFNYKNFLLPFWQATKAAEGDRASLQSVQLSMDYLADHYAKATEFYKDNASTKARILTSHLIFDKYYNITDRAPLYAASILLHPSLRRSYLDKQWAALSTKNETPYIENAVKATTSLWEKYKPQDGEAEGSSKRGELSSFDVFMQSVLQDNSTCDEFERFIKGDMYPNLQQFAIDVFTIPPMSAEPERLFSGGRRTVSWTRCRLSAFTIEMLECVKHWIKNGLDEPVEGEEDEDIFEPSPEELAQVEADWDELITDNLAAHVRRFALDEELDGTVSPAELFAMDAIPLVGQDEDSDMFNSERESEEVNDVDEDVCEDKEGEE